MKIAYIIDFDINKYSTSVYNKIVKKIRNWELLGNEIHLLVVSNNTIHELLPRVINIIVFERPSLNWLRFSSLKTYIGRNKAFGKMKAYLCKLKPDVIYYRPNFMWYPQLSQCLSFAPYVIEINSIDDEEGKLHYSPNGIRYKIFYYGRKKLMNSSKGIIALTNEIALHLTPYKKPTKVIANGYDTGDAMVHKSNRSVTNIRPQVIFIGTPDQPWQGFEEFAYMANCIPESDFHLIGPSSIQTPCPDNLKIYGYLASNEIEAIYSIADIGVGTLSLYVKNMQEACPLKVREYIAHGLPVVLGYADTDLEGQDFVLNIGCYKDNVEKNIYAIKEFINKYHDKSVPKEIAQKLIDNKQKEKARLVFIEQCRKM